MYWLLLICLATIPRTFTLRLPHNPALHYPLHRRGSRFARHGTANLTHLSQVITQTEKKYLSTYRDVEGNRLVRRWTPETWLDSVGLKGSWYLNLAVGQPSQILQVDLDMLSPDFYTIMTTSAGGSKYDTFQAQSHVQGQHYLHPDCRLAKDVLNLTLSDQLQFDWPICQAPKYSGHTLQRSGTIFGLAPHRSHRSSSLSRFGQESFLNYLQKENAISSQLWSITLLDSTSGILTLGGTLAAEMEESKARAELELRHIDKHNGPQLVEEELMAHLSLLGPTTEEQFRWLDVHGSAGWWTGLIGGIWINGIKILKNQPFLMDINCPFILAPPSVFTHFYDSMSGARSLEVFNGKFAAFPCLNPPHVAFELSGWQFPVMGRGNREDVLNGPTGGRFSMGKINDMTFIFSGSNQSRVGSGFCVGAIVQTTMGDKKEWKNSGMKGMWVLGEPFFQGLGIVFDSGKGRVGVRSY